jgi:hypothetical protein
VSFYWALLLFSSLEAQLSDWWTLTFPCKFTVSKADWAIVKAGIGGTKYVMDKYVEQGLGGRSRLPIPEASEEIKAMCDKELVEAVAVENSL